MSGFLVTGATGFIGRHLVRALTARGEQVEVLQRRQSTSNPILKDLRVRGAVVRLYSDFDEMTQLTQSIAPHCVFHLATHYVREHTASEIGALIEANVTMGTYLLDALVGSECTVVSAMSFFQFKGGATSPFSLYSATKQAFMEVTRFYRERQGLDVRNVVLFDTYGPEDTRDKIVPRLISAARNDEHFAMGPSAQPLDLLNVADVLSGLLAAAEPEQPAIMALRSDSEVTLRELVSVVERCLGHGMKKTFNDGQPVNTLIRESGDWSAPGGWSPRVGLDEGINQVWADALLTLG